MAFYRPNFRLQTYRVLVIHCTTKRTGMFAFFHRFFILASPSPILVFPDFHCYLSRHHRNSSHVSCRVVLSLVSKIKDLRGNPELPLPSLFAKKFSCCVSYRLVEVDDQLIKASAPSSTSLERDANLPHMCYMESTHLFIIIKLLKTKPESKLVVSFIYEGVVGNSSFRIMVASNICTWEQSGSGRFNV